MRGEQHQPVSVDIRVMAVDSSREIMLKSTVFAQIMLTRVPRTAVEKRNVMWE